MRPDLRASPLNEFKFNVFNIYHLVALDFSPNPRSVTGGLLDVKRLITAINTVI